MMLLSSKLNFENASLCINTGILFGIPVALHHEILDLPQKLAVKDKARKRVWVAGFPILFGKWEY